MRLIDADALKVFIKQNGYLYANTLDTFPAVDAVPVVRCGDCKYAYEGCQECAILDEVVVAPDFWCAYGERKHTATDD